MTLSDRSDALHVANIARIYAEHIIATCATESLREVAKRDLIRINEVAEKLLHGVPAVKPETPLSEFDRGAYAYQAGEVFDESASAAWLSGYLSARDKDRELASQAVLDGEPFDDGVDL
jgi:hypothetical protein